MRRARAAQRIAVAAAALWLAAVGWPCSAWPQAPSVNEVTAATLQGKRITAVRVVSAQPLAAGRQETIQENPPGLPVAPGDPFDMARVRESLKQLYRSGLYADVQVQATPAGDGVRLDFLVQENFFVNRVQVVGLTEPPSEAVALSVMRLGLGEVFTESKLNEALDRLRQLLEEESFFRAAWKADLARHPETRQMDITVHVDPGPRARIGAVRVSNHTPFRDETLIARARLKPGKQATATRRTRGAERLRRYLVGKGFLGSRVTVTRGAYDAQSNSVPLELQAVAGLRVRVEVAGVRVSASDLRQLLPIYQEGAVDEDLLLEGRRNLRAHFEQQGYFDTRVNYVTEEEPDTGTLAIRYQVERGARRRLVGLEIVGNEYFSDALLLGRMNIAPARFLSPGRFNTRMLEEEVASLRELYVANGFQQALVRSETMEDANGKKGDLFVRFHVDEGPQTRVTELHIEGNAALSTDFLLANVNSTPGQPYSAFNLATDRNNILALYLNEGFPEVHVETQAEPVTGTPATDSGPDPVAAGPAPSMRLVYRIAEGPQTTVKRVLIGGGEHTRHSLIARQVQIHPGGPLRQGDVIDTQRHLYDLGIFSRVQVAPQNPEGTNRDKTVLVRVDEAKRYTIAYGAGIEFQRLESRTNPADNELRASPRGLFEITRANVGGHAHTLAFKARASTLQGRALLSYSAPNLLARPTLTLLGTALYDRTRDVSTFTADRYEASAQVAWQPSPFNTFLFRYAFRRVVVDPDSLRIAPNEIPLFSQPTKISGPGFTWIRDRRDQPADATRGYFNTVDFSTSFQALGSDASFFRFLFQNSTYHRIGRALVFARSARFGLQEPFSDTLIDQIPLPERFFAGGGYSLRGFGLNQAGPRDPQTGFPLGGSAMLVFNHELRFPLHLPLAGQKLGGALFYDAGNVFRRAARITFRSQPSRADTASGNLSYFAHTLGIGLRYATPVGPVRVDLGYLLNPARFCAPTSITAPPCSSGAAPTRPPQFQIFFSIGSSF